MTLELTAPARPAVVLLSNDAEEIARWSARLHEAVDLRAASTVPELAALLKVLPADVIVAPCDARLLEGIQRCRHEARLILCGRALPAGVLEAAAQGYDLIHLDDVDALRREIHALVRPRSLMKRHPLRGLEVTWAGVNRPSRIVDVSNGGFSFRVGLDEEVERLLPGSVISSVEIRRGGGIALSAASAVVRYVDRLPADSGEPGYRIGCELTSTGASPAARTMRIADRARRAGLLREALRSGGLFLEGEEGMARGVFVQGGQVDLERGEMILDAEAGAFEPHDVVRGTFEYGGGSHSFLTSVVSIEPFRLRLPRSIDAAQRRSATRYRPVKGHPIAVGVRSPLLPDETPSLRCLLELSSTGFSFAFDPSHDLFPPGTRLSEIHLSLDGRSVPCSGSVRNIGPVAGSPHLVRCGVVFDELAPADRMRLADAVMRYRYPGLVDGRELTFEELWGFFKETRFLYAQKLETLAAIQPEVERTFAALLGHSDRVFKSLIYREDRTPIGHLSCVRSYRKTWVIQHLAGFTRTRGKQAPQILNAGVAEYIEHNAIEYVKIYFRPENKWPSRVFGGFARKLSDPHRSDLRTFEHLVVPTNAEIPAGETAAGIRIVEAKGSDLAAVEHHYVAQGESLLIRSDDLTRSSLDLSDLDADFRMLGLSRRRVTLLAMRGDVPLGFALCELTSPGVNLSELFSSMRIAVFPPSGLDEAEKVRLEAATRAELLRASLELYRKNGRPFAVALLPENDPGAAAIPSSSHKRYTCWTVHRPLYRLFCEHLERLYERLGKASTQTLGTVEPLDLDAALKKTA